MASCPDYRRSNSLWMLGSPDGLNLVMVEVPYRDDRNQCPILHCQKLSPVRTPNLSIHFAELGFIEEQ